MKSWWYFIETYKYDFMTAFFAVILYIISFSFASNERAILVLSLLITLVSVSIILFFRLKEKDFYFVGLTKRQDRDDWIGRGTFEYRRASKAYLVSEAEPGFIYSKAINWNDYQYQFEFKILNKCIGALVRAANLSDYIMFQIRDYGIRPHLRVNGGWQIWEADKANLLFSNNLSLDQWYRCTITCEKDLIGLKIENGKEILLSRNWTLPHSRLGFPFPQKEGDEKPTVIFFPVNLDYGTIGFRNAGDEKALVRNVLIRKL